jgi:HPt (histidine-containing phosphotransfer) domain-containing protein
LAKDIIVPTTPNIGPSDAPPARIVVPLPEGLPRKLVCDYLDACQKDLSALSAALVERDYERARVFGHQMKGTGSPFGFPTLTRFGTAIEQAAQKDTPALDHLVHQLEEYLSRVEIAGE